MVKKEVSPNINMIIEINFENILEEYGIKKNYLSKRQRILQ